MTPDDLKKMIDAATKGPWEAEGQIIAAPDASIVFDAHEADAIFIASLRNLAEPLLALWEAALKSDAGLMDKRLANQVGLADLYDALVVLENLAPGGSR